MKKIVFVCRRNIFRSQIAKGLSDHMSVGRVIAESYGTEVEREGNSGRMISEFPGMSDTIDRLKREGIDISGERCTQVTPSSLEGADKIIVLAEKEFIPEWLKKYDFEHWDVANPQNITSDYVEGVIALLKEKISALILSIEAELSV